MPDQVERVSALVEAKRSGGWPLLDNGQVGGEAGVAESLLKAYQHPSGCDFRVEERTYSFRAGSERHSDCTALRRSHEVG